MNTVEHRAGIGRAEIEALWSEKCGDQAKDFVAGQLPYVPPVEGKELVKRSTKCHACGCEVQYEVRLRDEGAGGKAAFHQRVHGVIQRVLVWFHFRKASQTPGNPQPEKAA